MQRRRDGAVVVPSVESGAVHHVADQLAAVVVGEYIIAGSALPGDGAGGGRIRESIGGEALPPPPAGAVSRRCCGDVLHARSSCTYNTRKSANMTIFEMLAIFIISLFFVEE